MINVVCAVIQDECGRVLACQRGVAQSHAGKWEFPGGKIEAGEEAREALKREIVEELDCQIEVGEALPVVEHRYPNFTIKLQPFLCQLNAENLPQALEHAELRWVTLAECERLDWAEADIPIWSAGLGKWLVSSGDR